jgi:hypothetical protein
MARKIPESELTDRQKLEILSLLPTLVTSQSTASMDLFFGVNLSDDMKATVLRMQEIVQDIVNGDGTKPVTQILLRETLENRVAYSTARYMITAAYALRKLRETSPHEYLAAIQSKCKTLKVRPLSVAYMLRITQSADPVRHQARKSRSPL